MLSGLYDSGLKRFPGIMEDTDHAKGKVVITPMPTDSQFALDDTEKYLVTCNGVKWFALVASALTETVSFLFPRHNIISFAHDCTVFSSTRLNVGVQSTEN